MRLITEYLWATKQIWVKSLTLKALAAHPVFCYRFSMTSTSSKAGIKRSNGFAFETNHWHRLFWTECWYLVTRQIFEHVLDPRWPIVYSHFHTATLHLFQTFIFCRKLPNLLIELWKLFYHSYFDNQGLILPDLAVAVNEQNIQAHVLRDRFYLDTTDECTDVNMPQPRQLTWNKTESFSIHSLRKQCLCW